MFGALARRVLSPTAVRVTQARNMAYISTEMPKANGMMYMFAGIGFFIISAGLVQANGLITWGRAPDMDAALKKD